MLRRLNLFRMNSYCRFILVTNENFLKFYTDAYKYKYPYSYLINNNVINFLQCVGMTVILFHNKSFYVDNQLQVSTRFHHIDNVKI